MAAASDIARLFAELALSLRRPNAGDGDGGDSGGEAAASAASSLAASLNPNPNPDASPRSRVLDAALSLMCFRAPEVYSCAIDSVVRTMISVLSSSVSCKVQRFEGGGNKKDEEILRVGSSISAADCEKLIGTCIDVLGNLEGHGLCHSLVQALLKAAVSASDYQSLFPMSCMYYEGCGIAGEIRNSAILKLQSLLPAENSVNNCEIPLRLLLWYLDPLLIKDTLSSILRETIHRPFLRLKSEFHERMAWRLLIVYLVTSPTMFTQTRALLHKWFLVTGLASVLELQIALVSSLLDVLSRPMWWGVSMELGLKLPFSHAYFSTCHSELLAVLTGPISCESFLSLVNLIGIPLAPAGNNINLTAYHLSPGIFHWNGAKVTRIDYNSTWAMLMNFPAWFYFATVLIFCGGKLEGKFLTNSRLGPVMAESRTEMELHHAAARVLGDEKHIKFHMPIIDFGD
uniref:Pre-mRNA-processing-splicing factor 8 n=1 Tax=Anthurium amnicola TaxID=1678845 RepID=A0A1D1Z9W9_9ARAE